MEVVLDLRLPSLQRPRLHRHRQAAIRRLSRLRCPCSGPTAPAYPTRKPLSLRLVRRWLLTPFHLPSQQHLALQRSKTPLASPAQSATLWIRRGATHCSLSARDAFTATATAASPPSGCPAGLPARNARRPSPLGGATSLGPQRFQDHHLPSPPTAIPRPRWAVSPKKNRR